MSTRARQLVTSLSLLPILATGCTSGPTPPVDGGADGGTDASQSITYTQHVRPILSRACVQCHSDGQIAPFALDTWERARPRAEAIAAATRSRVMPPFLANNSGSCNTFRDAQWLTDEEITTLSTWAAQGAPLGDPSIPAPTPVPPPTLTGEVHRISTNADYTPRADQPDDYRCFIAQAPIATGNYFVTGFDVQPGDRRVVHHVIVYHPRNADEAARAQALDDAEAGPGYTCFGAAGVQAAAVAAWAPGGGATHFPAGIGVQLAGGRPLVIQVHYNSLTAVAPDRTNVDLEVRTTDVLPGRFIPLADLNLELPPQTERATAGVTLRLADYTQLPPSVRVYGVFPHMHTLGQSMQVAIVRENGTEQCLVDVPRWDFHWQRLYFHSTPLQLRNTDSLRISCSYDTRARREPTRWGEGTLDEMCVAGIFVSL